MSTVTRRLAVFVTLLPLALAGCFETPVQERLQISFDGDSPPVVRAEVVFAEGVALAAVKERLTTLRQQYLDLRDPWTMRFERLEAKHETYEWERSQGELVRVARSARIDPSRLPELFYDTAINVSYSEREGVAELAMYAGSSQRATREQQSEYRDAVERFSRDVTAYFRAMDAVYRYLDAQPERAVPVFAALVGEEGEWEPPTEAEVVLLDRVSETTDRVMGILVVGQRRAWSFEEISSLVNDPFPASVVILPAGPVLEMEGFEPDEASGGIRVPRISLWSAFESLRGHWLSPDPLVALVENAQSEGAEPLSPEAMADEPRLSRPPRDWHEVHEELTGRLTPAGTYRARWILRRGGSDFSR